MDRLQFLLVVTGFAAIAVYAIRLVLVLKLWKPREKVMKPSRLPPPPPKP